MLSQCYEGKMMYRIYQRECYKQTVYTCKKVRRVEKYREREMHCVCKLDQRNYILLIAHEKSHFSRRCNFFIFLCLIISVSSFLFPSQAKGGFWTKWLSRKRMEVGQKRCFHATGWFNMKHFIMIIIPIITLIMTMKMLIITFFTSNYRYNKEKNLNEFFQLFVLQPIIFSGKQF